MALVALGALVGCGQGEGESPQEDGPVVIILEDMKGDEVTPPDMPPHTGEEMGSAGEDMAQDMEAPECDAPTGWDGATPAFANATDASQLAAINAAGMRISSADYDADGDVDLLIRRVVNTGDDFSEGGQRDVWLLRNDGGGVFEDVTESSGFVTRRDSDTTKGRPVEVAVWADVDNDGDLDAFTATLETEDRPEGAEIVLNNGDGTFSLAPLDQHDLQVTGRPINRGGAAFVDVDRDGHVDLWVGRSNGPNGPEQDNLYQGGGDGSFALVTSEWGLTTQPWQFLNDLNMARAHTNSWGVHACDLTNDGWPELLSASYGRAPNHLWHATSGDTRAYTNASLSSGYAFDDRQDWTDNESARCYCQINPSAAGCEGVPSPQYIRCNSESDAFRWGNHQYAREPFRLGGNSGTTLCADFNNDGWLDLLTAEIVHWDVGSSSDPTEILYNDANDDGPPSFTRPGNEVTGLARQHDSIQWDEGHITAAALDFDNDGRLDIYIGSTDYPGTRGLLYHQQTDGTFEQVPVDMGIDHKSSHGIAVADFDDDGDLDVVAGHSRNRCSSGDHCYDEGHARYFENLVGQDNHWLQLDLVGGDGANRAAIGARVTVTTPDGHTQTHEVGGGHGHYGIQHGLRSHFGLGDQCEATVTVAWPDAARTTETFTLTGNTRWRITQGEQPEAVTP